MAKSGSKLFVSIIAFLLGFIFAILVEVGAIFGVYVYVTTQDIDTILAAIGLPNKDENGNNRYINTDPENGGAKTVKDLIASLKDLLYDDGQLSVFARSFHDFDELIPATSMLLDMVYATVGEFIDLDHDKFENSPMTELAQVLSDSVMGVHIGTLLEKLNSDLATNSNIIVKSLLLGAETEYASVTYASGAEALETKEGESTGVKLPVMYDIYTNYDELGWFRDKAPASTSGGFPGNLTAGGKAQEDFIENTTLSEQPDADGKLTDRTAKLCYVPCRVTETSIEPAEYTIDYIEYDDNGEHYSFQYLDYAKDTDFIAVKSDAAGKYVLNHSEIWAALNANSTGSSDRFVGYSYLEEYGRNYYYIMKNPDTEKMELNTISGKNYFRDSEGKSVQLDALTLSDLINDAFGPLYSVAVTEVVGDNAKVAHDIFGKTSLGELLDGKVNFENLINDLEVSSFVNNVKPDNKLMAYIVFKLSDLKKVSEDTYTATYDKFGPDEKTVTVMLDEKGNLNAVYDGEILIEGVKVNQVAEVAQNMTVNLLMDVDADDAIMSYLGYGVYEIKKAVGEGLGYDYTAKVKVKVGDESAEKNCFVETEIIGDKNIIVSVWYLDEDGEKVQVKSTKVTEVSDKVDSFTDDLTIGDVIKIGEDNNQLLKSIKNTKISNLADKIENLTVKELFTEEQINSSTILRQLRNATLNNLSTEIDKVLIQRIYAEDVYGLTGSDNDDYEPALATEYREGLLYYEKDGDGYKLTEINCEGKTENAYDDALGHITSAQFEAGKYYTFGEAKGMWKLILYKNGEEKAYTLNNFNNMISESTRNIYNAQLGTLQDAGIITADVKGKMFKYKPNGGSEQTVALETLTLSALIDIVLSMST